VFRKCFSWALSLVFLVAPAIAADQPGDTGDDRDRIFYPGDTERLNPLARKLAGNFLLDQKAIWTSPFHMNRGNAGWWIGFGALTATLVATDNHTSKILENSQGQVRWANNVSRLGAGYTTIPFAAGFYAWGVAFNDDKARETGVLGAEAMLDTLVVAQVLKPIAGRNRPNSKDPGEFFDGGGSFPSGHSIASWALASVIAHEYRHQKFVPVIAYGLAAVVGGARIAAQQHYASDVVVGGAMGWFVGRYVYQTHQDHALHRHGILTPVVQPSSRTYGFALNIGG
jgi:membrane-associated phospholipid phosphatase